MPFPPRNLPEQLCLDLDHFITSNNLVELYRSYVWGNDTFQAGFPDILRLETQLARSDQSQGISLDDVKDVARWGQLRNPGRIAGNDIVLPPNTLHTDTGNPVEPLRRHPMGPICSLEENIAGGIGPTYLSKVLRFGLPQEYGAIDTRCVRVFGRGDSPTQRHDWLSIRARNDGYGWYIPKTQSAWPSGYGQWIDILRFLAHRLPPNCPHPPEFVALHLRSRNVWTCADVEMALFTYASQFT